MASTYAIKEVFHWTREGFSPRSILCVEHDGFTRTSCGFRIIRDGAPIFTAYAPFATREDAIAAIPEHADFRRQMLAA